MLVVLMALTIAAQDTARAAVPPDTYADAGTAELVSAARDRRDRQERQVTRYQATVTQRIGVGIRALRRDRMLFRQELAARIDWRRDSTSRIEMLGARQAVPIALHGLQVPDDLDNQAAFLAFDPSEDYLKLIGADGDGMLYPLAAGAEREYRYASGDTTRIRLPGGRNIRLIELRVTPRRSSFNLVAGSFWFDADTYGMVRAVFRPARPFDLELDGDSGDTDDVPGVLKPIRAEVRFITMEYGLYESRWWLPRFIAVDLEATIGSMMRVPARFERVYVIAHVEGGSEPPPGSALRWRAGGRQPRPAKDDSALTVEPEVVAAIVDSCTVRADSLRTTRAERLGRGQGDDSLRLAADGRLRPRDINRCVRRGIRVAEGYAERPDVTVSIPADTVALLHSPDLGAPILDMGDVISEGELRDLGQAIGALPAPRMAFRRDLSWGLVRYNRVEALSLGARGQLDYGRLSLSGTVRLGVADLNPNVEGSALRPSSGQDLQLTAYHRLASVTPGDRALGIGNSLTGLLFGRDDGDYMRATGVELQGRPGATRSHWYDWRVFAEQQRSVAKETNASLPRLFDGSRLFRPNITATRADQVGASLTLRGFHSYALGLGVGSDLTVEGQTGDYSFARASLATRATLPMGRNMAGLEVAGGTSTGPVTPQALFYLGGPATLRGYGGNTMNGQSFWRARAELARGMPAVRLAIFSDAGWAGPRSAIATGTPLVSAGVGVSVLDGLLRVDLGRAMRSPRGWRLDFYADGVL